MSTNTIEILNPRFSKVPLVGRVVRVARRICLACCVVLMLGCLGCGNDASCPEGTTECQGSCVDLTTNEDHCGACDNACGDQESCTESLCAANCPLGFSLCDGRCVDFQLDPDNCGGCANACPQYGTCRLGDCECPPGMSDCGGRCGDDTDGDGMCDDVDPCPDLTTHGTPEILNSGFGQVSDWTVADGATIDASATGHLDPGEADLGGCDGASIRQTVCVSGDYQEVGGLSIDFGRRTIECTDAECPLSTLQLILNGRVAQDYPHGNAYTDQTLCLGEIVYSSQVEVALQVDISDPLACQQYGSDHHFVDNVIIQQDTAGNCPAPGTVLNGDLENGPTGWTTGGNGISEISDDGAGNQVVHLQATAGVCMAPFAESLVSAPLDSSLPHAALQFRLRGTVGTYMRVLMPGSWSDIDATSTWTTQQVCIPTQHLGFVKGFSVQAINQGFNCGPQPFREYFLDDFEVVSAPTTCP